MASWVSDGSSQLQISGQVVTCTAGPGGDVYNAMWKDGDGINSGEHYWKINLTNLGDSGAFVGLTNEKKFAKGWSARGIFYGGNLSNGSGLLVQNFGPRFKSGDTVGILASVSDGKLEVYFDHNGSALGLGFNINSSIIPNFHPIVQFCGSGSATITTEGAVPPPEARNRVSKTFSGIEGNWKISSPENIKLSGKAFKGKNNDGDRLASISLTLLEGSAFKVSLRVINHIGFNIEQSDKTWKCTAPGMSTLMAGPPELMELESKLSALAQSPESVQVSGNQLILKSANAEATFGRYDDTPSAYSEDPFA